jgi:hypothetical protein
MFTVTFFFFFDISEISSKIKYLAFLVHFSMHYFMNQILQGSSCEFAEPEQLYNDTSTLQNIYCSLL